MICLLMVFNVVLCRWLEEVMLVIDVSELQCITVWCIWSECPLQHKKVHLMLHGRVTAKEAKQIQAKRCEYRLWFTYTDILLIFVMVMTFSFLCQCPSVFTIQLHGMYQCGLFLTATVSHHSVIGWRVSNKQFRIHTHTPTHKQRC